MPNIENVNKEISELESKGDSSWLTYERLAWLYVVRDHMRIPIIIEGESEFLRTINGKDSTEVWSVMDELMETLKVVQPRVYSSVLRKCSITPEAKPYY